ncbi:hypothetical protein DVH07_00050 [Hafnia paralvei]|nr:hypothetical protein DU449_00175 [Hafnia paralvei]RDA73773.1 hypothetical protein DVH09_00050 [Hafnia paralvei]RDA74030.1 hypothetical protein DVH08_00100 [Hafnia paralvei]RDA82285.1 hypothetical protein DVH10_00060 [Hafnia paralvei]RDA82316.1 hypothetical protein DVH07_00050 [Hafnia paralvei]
MLVSVFVLSFISVPAMAAGPDFTPLTDGIDFASVIAGIMAVFALIAGVYVALAGGKKIIAAIRGA